VYTTIVTLIHTQISWFLPWMKPVMLHGAVYNARGCTENTTTTSYVYTRWLILMSYKLFNICDSCEVFGVRPYHACERRRRTG